MKTPTATKRTPNHRPNQLDGMTTHPLSHPPAKAPMVATNPSTNLQPLGDRVLVERQPIPSTLLKPDPSGNEAFIVPGLVLAVGPGKRDDDGYLIPMTVQPGQQVMFNARWNDFAHDELAGSDCDRQGPLERPLPWWHQKGIHLIQEADIAMILGTGLEV